MYQPGDPGLAKRTDSYPYGVWLAGTSLSDDLVVELARRLERNGAHVTAQALLRAAVRGRSAAALDRNDRGNILAALTDRPADFEELYNVLLRQIERRRDDR